MIVWLATSALAASTSPVAAHPLGDDIDTAPALSADADLAGRIGLRTPAVGLTRVVELSRARVEVGVGSGHAQARLALTPTRSGGATGYVGVAGESLVPIVQIAEARVDVPVAGLAVAAGVVDDLWAVTGQSAWGLPAVSDTAGLAFGMVNRSDLGAWASWSAPDRWFSVTAQLASGEGHQRRERNNGKDISILATVRPLRDGDTDVLGVSLLARDGSRGLLSAADHRMGARIWTDHRLMGAGLEYLRGLGSGGDPSLRPHTLSMWTRTGHDLPAVGWIRLDQSSASRDVPMSGTLVVHAGAGPRVPLAADGSGAVLIGWQRGRVGDQASGIAGAGDAAAWDLLFLQVGVRERGSVGLTAL